MKKNLLKLMFLSACALMLSACSNNTASTETSTGESADTSAQVSTEAGDSTAKGYNPLSSVTVPGPRQRGDNEVPVKRSEQ